MSKSTNAVYFPIILMMSVLLITMIISALCYPEPYLFWDYHVSDFGATETPTGIPNTTAFIFWIGVGLIVFIALYFALFLRPIIFRLLLAISAFGFACVILPTNLYHTWHRL